MPENDLKASLLAFMDTVWSSSDAEAAAAATDAWLADSYTIHHDPGDPWDGQTLDRAGYKQRLTASRAPFPDQRFTIVDAFEAGDKVAITWTWAATHAGDIPGFPASGRAITMSGATVYYFENGRISGHWQVTDRLGVFRQLQGGRG